VSGFIIIKQITDCCSFNRVPTGEGYSLYIRPTGVSTTVSIGVGAPTSAKLYVICSPVGPYYPGTRFLLSKFVRHLISDDLYSAIHRGFCARQVEGRQ
jgi:branched-subunit amino acid aminotransferase/4-amino-4-deoxychorismate lyase